MPQNGGGKGWKWDEETGSKVMPENWNLLLDWLLLGPDREPKHQYQLAEELGMHEDSIRRIKRDPRFMREWDRRAAELNISPERTQSVVDALYQQAANGDVKAASLYLQYIDRFTPKRKVVVGEDRDASSMTDEELASELESEIRHLRIVEAPVE